jgi:hypothetical protein
MSTKKTTKHASKKKGVPVAGIAAGVIAAAAAASATYYFYAAKDAKKHRKVAAKWANDMKLEVVREAKKLEKLDDKVMHEIVDRVAKTYRAAKSVDPAEIRQAAMELKANWENMRAELKGPVARAVKKTVKKVAKKVVKKSTKTA